MRQVDMILEHLETKGPITQLEALKLYGCGRLSGRIWDLRHAGHPIEMRYKKVRKATGGNAVVAEYYIDRND